MHPKSLFDKRKVFDKRGGTNTIRDRHKMTKKLYELQVATVPMKNEIMLCST
jgi:hypothetical protein